MKQLKGFSLIELMIVVAIIGILASIVVPSYRNFLVESRRNEGITILLSVMQHQERFYTEQLIYTTDLTNLGLSATPESENGHYQVSAADCGGDPLNRCVLLTATAQGDQASDGNLTLDSRGVRSPASFW